MMEPERFDAWTRRRFGLVAGGLAAILPALGWVLQGAAEPHHHHHHHHHHTKKHHHKKPCPDCPTCSTLCRKPLETCEGGCCEGLSCDSVRKFIIPSLCNGDTFDDPV